jgi:hypothetical protein
VSIYMAYVYFNFMNITTPKKKLDITFSPPNSQNLGVCKY